MKPAKLFRCSFKYGTLIMNLENETCNDKLQKSLDDHTFSAFCNPHLLFLCFSWVSTSFSPAEDWEVLNRSPLVSHRKFSGISHRKFPRISHRKFPGIFLVFPLSLLPPFCPPSLSRTTRTWAVKCTEGDRQTIIKYFLPRRDLEALK